MIPVMQQVVGSGLDGQPMGDCIRACVASIFEMQIDDVPHFAAHPKGWFRCMQDWLRPMALVMEHAQHEASDTPPLFHYGWWMASVVSENIEGATHAVVMRGLCNPGPPDLAWEVAHDPSPHPRRTPYRFVGACHFAALDPAIIGRRWR